MSAVQENYAISEYGGDSEGHLNILEVGSCPPSPGSFPQVFQESTSFITCLPEFPLVCQGEDAAERDKIRQAKPIPAWCEPCQQLALE